LIADGGPQLLFAPVWHDAYGVSTPPPAELAVEAAMGVCSGMDLPIGPNLEAWFTEIADQIVGASPPWIRANVTASRDRAIWPSTSVSADDPLAAGWSSRARLGVGLIVRVSLATARADRREDAIARVRHLGTIGGRLVVAAAEANGDADLDRLELGPGDSAFFASVARGDVEVVRIDGA
jgi:hypothetical protein